MTINKHALCAAMIMLFLAACVEKNEPTPTTPTTPMVSDNLVMTIQDEFTTLPAKVSVFFKVTTEDGTPVADLKNEDFNIYEKGRNDSVEKLISKNEADQQISSNAQVFSYNTLLVLDLSGSVVNTKLSELKAAAQAFIDEVMPTQTDSATAMTILWFDGEDILHELAPRTSNRFELKAAIEGISSGISNDNSTDLYGAVLKSIDKAETILDNTTTMLSAVSIVVFTDGSDQAARYLKQDALDAVGNASPKISFYTIGLGNEVDQDVLSSIGKNAAAFADNTEQLTGVFQTIATSISSEANSFYLFEYCSPKRNGSGESQLRINITRGAQVGNLTTNFDATGFQGGCSL